MSDNNFINSNEMGSLEGSTHNPANPFRFQGVPGMSGRRIDATSENHEYGDTSRKRSLPNDPADDDDDNNKEAKVATHYADLDASTGIFHVDALGNLLLMEKHRTIPCAAAERRNAVIKQAQVLGKARAAWYGTFTHIAGAKKMLNDFFKNRSKSTAFALSIAELNQDPEIAPQPDSGLTLPMLPLLSSSTFKLPRQPGETTEPIWQCANCGRFGHTLGDCVVPSYDGADIDGCPLCNTKEHLFDQCHNGIYMNPELLLRILYFRREGKCQIRSDREIYELFSQFIEYEKSQGNDVENNLITSPPWTRAFAFNVLSDESNIQKLRQWDYSDLGLPVQADNTLTVEKVLVGQLSSSYSLWLERKMAKQGKGKQVQQPAPTDPVCGERMAQRYSASPTPVPGYQQHETTRKLILTTEENNRLVSEVKNLERKNKRLQDMISNHDDSVAELLAAKSDADNMAASALEDLSEAQSAISVTKEKLRAAELQFDLAKVDLLTR
ncbi:hypothetical protein PG984_014772 [Apiospora sp. TS-2023a]